MSKSSTKLKPADQAQLQQLESRFSQFGQLFVPAQAEQPILTQTLRAAVHQWLVEFANAGELEALDVKPRMRAMFFGPPGCGKTTLAHHIAARHGLPMLVVDSSLINSKYVHETGEKIARLFASLRMHAEKLVLFFDEIDALAPKRMAQSQSSDRSAAADLIALMQNLDRYEGLMIAATNQHANIDKAVWRRFDIHLEIGIPDEEARWAILKRYLEPLQLPQDALDALATLTEGASPALLKQTMEGIKRDLVISPRLKLPVDAVAVIGRTVASVHPPEEMEKPLLWNDGVAQQLAGIAWPPTRP